VIKYVGESRGPREAGPCTVWIVDTEAVGAAKFSRLDPRHDLRNHSPDGFAWGYGGSGPAQLALAILADALDDREATRLYQRFKFDVVGRWDKDAGFEVTHDEVVDWYQELEERS